MRQETDSREPIHNLYLSSHLRNLKPQCTVMRSLHVDTARHSSSVQHAAKSFRWEVPASEAKQNKQKKKQTLWLPLSSWTVHTGRLQFLYFKSLQSSSNRQDRSFNTTEKDKHRTFQEECEARCDGTCQESQPEAGEFQVWGHPGPQWAFLYFCVLNYLWEPFIHWTKFWLSLTTWHHGGCNQLISTASI